MISRSWFGSVPTVPAACKGNELLTDTGCATNGFDNFEKIWFWRTPTAKCETGGHLRTLLAVGKGLHRHPRQVMRPTKSGPGLSKSRAAPAMAQPMSPAVRFVNVCRHFGSVRAVDGVTLDIAEGEFFAMLGPSGSGKTTCLRLIAGFEQPNEGHIEIFGETAEGVPPYKRNVNTVFQDYALFPHMTVGENVAYGLMIKGVDRGRARSQGERRARHGQARRIRASAAPRSFPAASASAWLLPARW